MIVKLPRKCNKMVKLVSYSWSSLEHITNCKSSQTCIFLTDGVDDNDWEI